MSRSAIAALLFGCTRPAASPAPVVEAPLITVREDAFGPITAKTPATLGVLRGVLAGYDVAAVNADSLEYRVSKAGARLFDIVPDDAGAILNIHVLTPRIAIAGHAWRVGAPLPDAVAITTCECWGDQTVCFKDGEHVAVGLAKICREGTLGTATARKALAGVAIRATIWSARPLAPGGSGAMK